VLGSVASTLLNNTFTGSQVLLSLAVLERKLIAGPSSYFPQDANTKAKTISTKNDFFMSVNLVKQFNDIFYF
jgi:hypothetical protein